MRRRLGAARGDAGFTIVELLVGAMMGAIVMAAVASLVISAMKTQPNISGEAQNVTTARWVLERLTREIRNGIVIESATPSSVTFRAYVRRASCGGTGTLSSASPSIECKVTYSCTTSACFRTEVPPTGGTGTPRRIFEGINSNQVFTYSPAEDPTYVKATLRLPDPNGKGALTISNGASLRNATLGY